jgi:hypothetical protein
VRCVPRNRLFYYPCFVETLIAILIQAEKRDKLTACPVLIFVRFDKIYWRWATHWEQKMNTACLIYEKGIE